MPETILVTQADSVCVLTLNRPEVMNALSVKLLEELRDALKKAQEDRAVRCVVLAGQGRAFCAGADLTGKGLEQGVQHMLDTYYHPVIEHIVTMPKPVIAAVNGVAAGAGMSLALACDLRLASTEAVFTTAFTRIGLTIDAGGSYFLPQLVGRGRAFELAYSSRKIGAEEALQLGLAEVMMEAEGFEVSALAYASELASGATQAFAAVKRQLNAALVNDLSRQLALESELQQQASQTTDFAEGVRAFAEKRAPVFRGE